MQCKRTDLLVVVVVAVAEARCARIYLLVVVVVVTRAGLARTDLPVIVVVVMLELDT